MTSSNAATFVLLISQALTRTLVLAAPELLKFLLCGGILFIAFALCGWIVLGPYHSKVCKISNHVSRSKQYVVR